MEASGDLVVCASPRAPYANETILACPDGQRLWSAGTGGHAGAHAEMQQFGVLAVLVPSSTSPYERVWQSHTMALAGCNSTSQHCAYLTMQKDGNCVLRSGTGPGQGSAKAIWDTATSLPPADAKNVLHFIIDDLVTFLPADQQLKFSHSFTLC